jgi:hypothetical protein
MTWNLLLSMMVLPIALTNSIMAHADQDRSQDLSVDAWLVQLEKKFRGFEVTQLPAGPGKLALSKQDSYTIEDLRGIDIDEHPPALRSTKHTYAANMVDPYPPGEGPYVAEDIRPFRFQYFNNEFNYGGWYNHAMADYAAMHGFNILLGYNREIEGADHLPNDTRWLTWGGLVVWSTWLGNHGIPDGRWDQLQGLNLVAMHLKERALKRERRGRNLSDAADYLMVDMEHLALPLDILRRQTWYPSHQPKIDQLAFERRYYDGYASTFISVVEAALAEGWKNVSVYGWAPYARTWFGLDEPEVQPATDFAWNAYGQDIYDSISLINNSVYCFYWSAKNVAYTLANIDSNMRLIRSAPKWKPVRPYFSTVLQEGGDGWRWWRDQPLPTEEVRAMIAMAFFTGIDGIDLWNWSGRNSHHVPPSLLSGDEETGGDSGPNDVMLRTDLVLVPDEVTKKLAERHFGRYDVLHIIERDYDRALVRVQSVEAGLPDRGIGRLHPTYTIPAEKLEKHLRVISEPVSAVIEGLALVKPIEYLLRHGEVHIDVDAREQWKEGLPVVRRVTFGLLHVLITYDPTVIYGGRPRTVTLANFAGAQGRDLEIPADAETRIFVLRDSMSGQ